MTNSHPLAALIAGVPRRYDIDPVFNYLREDLVLAALEAAPSPEVVKELVEALESLLEAITAENRHGDRSLTITGPTANLKWLLEAQEDARTALAKLEGGE